MATDVLICPFSIPPQAKARRIAQPLELFKSRPHVIGLSGIGSDTFMAPTDTERKPREPWGGTPFAREAAMYRAKSEDGKSVLTGLLKSQARGIEVGRVALIGFSAGGTFIKAVLENPEDRKMIDTVILLDALMISKNYNGSFISQAMEPWVAYAASAMYAGVKSPRGTGVKDPFMGPVFISTHTNIKQSAALEKQVGNTTASTDALTDAAGQRVMQLQAKGEYEDGSIKHIVTNWKDLVTGFPADAFPCTIGPPKPGQESWAAGVPGPVKTWTSMPMPLQKAAWGNYYDLDYGGTVAADHVFQSWHVQGAVMRTFLIPRWNAEQGSPYSVAGWQPCCPGPGGNIVGMDTGPSLVMLGAALAAGFVLGKTLLE